MGEGVCRHHQLLLPGGDCPILLPWLLRAADGEDRQLPAARRWRLNAWPQCCRRLGARRCQSERQPLFVCFGQHCFSFQEHWDLLNVARQFLGRGAAGGGICDEASAYTLRRRAALCLAEMVHRWDATSTSISNIIFFSEK